MSTVGFGSLSPQLFIFTASPILPEETEIHGWLLPASDDTPHNSCGMIGIGKYQLLVIAGSNAIVNRGTQKFRALYCRMLSGNFFSIAIKKGWRLMLTFYD